MCDSCMLLICIIDSLFTGRAVVHVAEVAVVAVHGTAVHALVVDHVQDHAPDHVAEAAVVVAEVDAPSHVQRPHAAVDLIVVVIVNHALDHGHVQGQHHERMARLVTKINIIN